MWGLHHRRAPAQWRWRLDLRITHGAIVLKQNCISPQTSLFIHDTYIVNLHQPDINQSFLTLYRQPSLQVTLSTLLLLQARVSSQHLFSIHQPPSSPIASYCSKTWQLHPHPLTITSRGPCSVPDAAFAAHPVPWSSPTIPFSSPILAAPYFQMSSYAGD